jgi:WD40 repeat protein
MDLIEVATGQGMATWTAPDVDLKVLALHPDGGMVACGTRGPVIYLRDAATGRELAHWEAHDTAVTALEFSPDGRTLLSGSADGTLKLWDLPTIRRELAALGLDWEGR